MKITATRQILGDYGTLYAGESKDIADDTAKQLLKSGLVVPFVEKAIEPEEQPVPVIADKAICPSDQPVPAVEAPAPKIQNKGK